MWTPRNGRDGLLVLGHDGTQLELIVSVVQLKRQQKERNSLKEKMSVKQCCDWSVVTEALGMEED